MAVVIRVISPKRLTLFLSSLVVFLFAANVGGQFSRYYLDHPRLCGFNKLFYAELHGNMPHWFKSTCMLMIGMILFFIYKIKATEQDRFRNHWLGLCVIFFLMSVVQTADVHNAVSPCIRSMLGVGEGWFYFAWVIPAFVFAIAVGIAYLRFLLDLPRVTRSLFFAAGFTYVFGAIVFEMATAYYFTSYGEDFTFALLSAFHEALKMAALVLFIHATLEYLGTSNRPFHLLLSHKERVG